MVSVCHYSVLTCGSHSCGPSVVLTPSASYRCMAGLIFVPVSDKEPRRTGDQDLIWTFPPRGLAGVTAVHQQIHKK